MKRTFLTNLAILLFLNLLVKPFWIFGIDRTIQNTVGAESYGFYFSLFNFSLMLNILLDLGITNFNNRNISQHHQLFSKYLSNVVILKFLLAIVYGIICTGLALIIGYGWEQIKLLLLLMFNQFLISFVLYLRSNISGLQLFKTDSLVSVLDKALMIIICSVLLWGHVFDSPFQIEWFVYSQTAAYGITAIITFFIVLSKSKFLHLKFDFTFFRAILKQSYPYALLILLMALYNRVDSVMLERMLPDGKEQAGIYAQAFRILEAASMFSYLFGALLLPMFSKMLKQKESVEQLTQFSYSLVIIPSFILVIGTFIYRHEIMYLLYNSHIDASADIMGLLMFAFLAISTTYIFGTLLTANGSLKYLNIMAAIGMGLNIVLNLILIPKFQATGSAIASLFTQMFTALAQVIIAKKIFNFRMNYKFLILLFAFAGISIGMAYLIKFNISNWILGFFLICGISGILAFSFKLINLKSLYLLFLNKDVQE
ncbi:MAG TPA: polysaccharide biosynthesis protein [Bacteroidales bacterium]|nr:MAG: hypothetical protein A2X01_06840 [Bacteroidetes bacterium GWF2_35_48]OFZ01987.1 MAG: hypothetical protein A2491_17960 [Bacteroidetes bacterium RIFOXYC12_FULL_35_7]HBX53102.1 polysaccharide biosynthesis protein [Bacteroidales bacterium]